MSDLSTIGRVVVLVGLGIAVIGGVLWLAGRVGVPVGRLPGDLNFDVGGVRVFLPCATSIILSLLLTVGLNIVLRLLNR